MTEDKLNQILECQNAVSALFESEAAIVKSEEFESMDGLNKDLLITECNAMQTLLGVMSIRIGLNLVGIQQARKEAAEAAAAAGEANEEAEGTETAPEIPNTEADAEATTSEDSKSE